MSALRLALRRYTSIFGTQCHTSRMEISMLSLLEQRLSSPASYTVSRLRCFSTEKTERPMVNSTMDEKELSNFAKMSQSWWDEQGELGMLHRMNKLRVPFIRDGIMNQRESPPSVSYLPLEGMTIVDAGCGGGVLTEPLARLGAFVIGVDAVEEGLKAAEDHVAQDPSIRDRVKYIHGTVEDLVGTEREKFDALVCSEVVEHVADLDSFLDSCCQLVKPGGSIFITTINKTMLSRALAVFVAERVLRLVPEGTHDWEKFVPPEDLQFILSNKGFTTRVVHGMCYNPATHDWTWIKDTSVNYALHAIKATPDETDNHSGTETSQE